MTVDFQNDKIPMADCSLPGGAVRFLRYSASNEPAAAQVLPIPEDARFILVLGNFDGVHPAHRALIREAFSLREKIALSDHEKAERIEVAAWYFDPPSSDFIPNRKAGHLTTVEEKRALFASLGLQYGFEADFSLLRNQSPVDFFSRTLKSLCHGIGFVCGYNYRFGQNAAGDAASLTALAPAGTVVTLPAVCDAQGQAVSASRIRALLEAGQPERARSLMGRPYTVTGIVRHGKALGRTLGFPTVNLSFSPGKFIPKCGVYFTSVSAGGREYGGVTNIGMRPTTDGVSSIINCETHILNCEENFYGQTVTVSLLTFHREERIFPSLSALREALTDDCDAARCYFRQLSATDGQASRQLPSQES